VTVDGTIDVFVEMPTPPPTLAPTPPIGGASSSNGTCPTNGTAESMIDDFIGIGGASSSDGTRVARVRQNDNENAGTSRRRLQVYDVMDGGWTQVGNDLIESATKDWFGSAVAFSSDGSRIAVGAPGSDNENGKDAGKVQIYDLMEGRWTQIGNDLIGGADREYFGDALAFSADGTRLVVGTTLNDNENGKDAGLVLVYDLMEGTWTQVGNELIGSATFDWFGKAVALSSDGTRLVVGATMKTVKIPD